MMKRSSEATRMAMFNQRGYGGVGSYELELCVERCTVTKALAKELG